MASSPFELDESFVKSKIPPRRRDSHKGMNGVVCIVGGSRNYHGAPFLAAMAALRTGVDLVYVAAPKTVVTPIRALSPDLIVVPLTDEKLTRGAASRLASWLPQLGALAIGPGLGPQNLGELKRAVGLLAEKCGTLVADADALRPSILEPPGAPLAKLTVTPHAGEFERLFGEKPPEELESRVALVRKAASQRGVVILLKGPVDVISDGELVATNRTHSPAMTVGGTGDVLTGVTTGLAAKGLGRFEAACCAAFLCGLAGEEATKELGFHIAASDLLAWLPKVMKRFDKLE